MDAAARAWERQAGRTNTHTAVLAVIIGALMVFIAWSGRDLYAVAQDFMTRRDIESMRALVLRYKAAWGALPGDDPKAAARWNLPPARAPEEDGTARDTAGNGRIDGPVLALVDVRTEGHLAWRHLDAAGTGWDGAWGRVGFARAPVNRYGGLMALTSDAFGLRTALCLTSVPAKAARRLDVAADDGDPATGRVRAGPDRRGLDDAQPDVAGKRTLRDAGLPSDERRAAVVCAEIDPNA